MQLGTSQSQWQCFNFKGRSASDFVQKSTWTLSHRTWCSSSRHVKHEGFGLATSCSSLRSFDCTCPSEATSIESFWKSVTTRSRLATQGRSECQPCVLLTSHAQRRGDLYMDLRGVSTWQGWTLATWRPSWPFDRVEPSMGEPHHNHVIWQERILRTRTIRHHNIPPSLEYMLKWKKSSVRQGHLGEGRHSLALRSW